MAECKLSCCLTVRKIIPIQKRFQRSFYSVGFESFKIGMERWNRQNSINTYRIFESACASAKSDQYLLCCGELNASYRQQHARIQKIFSVVVQVQTRVGRSDKVVPFQNPYRGKLRGPNPHPTSLSAHEQELHRVDAEPTIENMFNNRLCDECGPKNGNKILPFVTDFVWDF